MDDKILAQDPEILRLREAYQLAMSSGDTAGAEAVRQQLINDLPAIEQRAQLRAEYGPTKAAMVAAGSRFAELGEGARMLAAKALDREHILPHIEAQRAERERLMDPLSEARPGATALGESLPGAVLPGGAGKTLISRGLGAGAATGGEEAVATGGNVPAALTSAAFGVAGNEGGRILQRGIFGRPATSMEYEKARTNDPAVQNRQVEEADRLGWKLTPGARKNDPVRLQTEASFARSPFMSQPFLELAGENQDTANKYAREAIGLSGSEKIDDIVLQERHDTLGKEFERLVGKDAHFPLENSFYDALNTIEQAASRGITRDPELANRIGRLREKAQDQFISVKDYQQTASDLARLGRNTDDPAMERAMLALRDALDFEFEKGFPGQRGDLGKVRSQWRNLRDIEQSRSLDGGDFRPTVFYNYLRGRYGRVAPGSDLNDIAITAKNFRERIPNSGTPTGLAMPDFLNASPWSRAAMAGGNTISNAYMATGGGLGLGSQTYGLPRRAMLPSVTDLLIPRYGREAASAEAEELGL